MMRQIVKDSRPGQSITPGVYTSTETGAGVSLANAFGALVLIDVGTRTDGTHTFEVQEYDGSSWSAVADADLVGDSEPVVDGAADDDQVYAIEYIGRGEQLRVVSTVAGASSGAAYGATITPYRTRKKPAA